MLKKIGKSQISKIFPPYIMCYLCVMFYIDTISLILGVIGGSHTPLSQAEVYHYYWSVDTTDIVILSIACPLC